MFKFLTILLFFLSTNLYGAGTTSEDSNNTDASNEVSILYERAEKYIDEKNFNKSLLVLKNLTKREDLYGLRSDIYNLLGFSYRKLENPELEKSFSAYMMAIEIDPDHIGAHEYLGELYLMMGDKSKAEKMLIKLELLVGKNAKEYLDLKKAILNF